jgi:ergothioneine biosynthesis protein EgtB
VLDHDTAGVGTARMRHAGRELLSLALIDARNQTLRWIAAMEATLGPALAAPRRDRIDPPLWTLGHLAWFQEHWIARNVQRRRGEACDPTHPRLASIRPDADRWYDPTVAGADARWTSALPDLAATRQYLVDTLETTLDLLASVTGDEDDALYFDRLVLSHEDWQAEVFARLAQTVGFDPKLLARPQSAPVREPILLPPTRWTLGSPAGGFAWDNERAAHVVAIPEFEIDAQPVTWAQYVEFVEDGGYDEPLHWTRAGWEWVQREGRRTPRHVDQMRHAVLQHRFGELVRVPLAQPAMHVTWYEADAWCRWSGRRLPTEVEWEAAAHQAASRGFRWGDVWEWTGTTFHPYPGFAPGPWRDYSQPAFGSHRALRGASFATAPRLKHPKMRAFLGPERDDAFTGFRSCAI